MQLLWVLVVACLVGGGALAQPINIFGNAVPNNPMIPDSAVTLGVKFYSMKAGTISGIRFYRAKSNPNGYRVNLYTFGGSPLGSASSKRDTCAVPCWEEIDFASPIPISANTTYIAAYRTSNGEYADDEYTSGGLTDGFSNGPLIANPSTPGSGTGGNGVYTYSTGFPNSTWHDSNYYVDVAFTPNAPTLVMSFNPPSPTISSSTPLGTTVATVNVGWSDGSQFTGTLGFGQPYLQDGGTFALSGSSIVVNPHGPGVSSDGGTIQRITVVATQ